MRACNLCSSTEKTLLRRRRRAVADKGIADAGIESQQHVTLLIGPEGGLSERDRLLLRAAGYQGLRLGPRILRTETAGLAALAAINALYGDWR